MSKSRLQAAAAREAADPQSPGVALGGLDAQVGFMLRLAQVAVFKDLIEALRPFGLRPTDFSVLLVIEATPGLKQQAVGEALSIQRPNLVTIIDQLEGRGLVKRGAAPGDRRSYALALTPEGEKLLAGAKAAHGAHTERVTAALGDMDKHMVLEALTRIARMA
ncbi:MULTISPECIES: MarR family winged helix-turn-helix transcriptional regulator [unclassified Phenylobacterium]|uniref:MarR family winged helix-turn-helix transcriptional regulator n=1 Tax=unclassified Phenylobacterium TaxID=2640670 RepID=UPI00083AE632|nr:MULTISPECIES: MarR family transcriptional regulator [unclassified Phenylobacterium]